MSSALSGATSPDSSRPSAGTGLRANRANRFPSRFIGCQRRTVTAAFDGNSITSALDAPGTHYVARIRNNALLKRLAVPAIDALASEALDRPGDSDRCGTWSCELDKPYRAPPRTTRRCIRPPERLAGRAWNGPSARLRGCWPLHYRYNLRCDGRGPPPTPTIWACAPLKGRPPFRSLHKGGW